jgi:hypothetical protein
MALGTLETSGNFRIFSEAMLSLTLHLLNPDIEIQTRGEMITLIEAAMSQLNQETSIEWTNRLYSILFALVPTEQTIVRLSTLKNAEGKTLMS